MMINIAELLKDCPEGTKLYSPLFGDVKLRCAHLKGTSYPIVVKAKDDDTLMFDEYGRYFDSFKFPDAECLLFPSKDCRTWERWKLPVEPKFKVGDWITNGTFTHCIVSIVDGFYYFYGGGYLDFGKIDGYYHLWTIADAKDGDVLATDNGWTCIFQAFDGCVFSSYCFMDSEKWFFAFGSEAHTPDSRINGNIHPATKEQRDLLFQKMKEAGYQWNADKKELKKIQPHYDIANFHAGMPVLVRDYDNTQWRYVQFSHCVGKDNPIMFNACGNTWEQCIPFEGNEHLLGTTDMPSEEYINW